MLKQFKLWRHIRRERKLDMLVSLALPNETVRRRHSRLVGKIFDILSFCMSGHPFYES